MESSRVLAAIATVAVLGLAYYFTVPGDHEELGNLRHATKPGPFKEDFWPEHGYVDLGSGKTHYYLLGPADGQKLVFVHGITSPPPTISSFLERLASKGYRVLCYGTH
jgi:hypothetical protein